MAFLIRPSYLSMFGYTKFRLCYCKPVLCFSSRSALDLNTNVVKDVILFKYENPRFFKYISFFGMVQFGLWTYLAVFSISTLKDAPVEKVSNEDLPWWKKVNLGENKYKRTLTSCCLLFGWGILASTWMYTLRSVRYLVLNKGGTNISFVTYTPFGPNRITTVPLDKVSCLQSRSSSRVQLPLKVKNKWLYYLLDMRGEFKNPSLFDHTAGMRRKLQ